jgi:hypothetical protein
LKYIINQKKKGTPSDELAEIYRVSTGYINKIYYNYINYSKTELYIPGRKLTVECLYGIMIDIHGQNHH